MIMSDERRDSKSICRRDLLTMVGGVAAMSAVGGLAGCAPANNGPDIVEVPLESVAEGGRLEVTWDEMPVELRRDAGGIQVRSLWCTHSGCRVRWQEEGQVYFCACHEGKFDASGRPIAGPPPRPLSEVPFTVDGSTVRVGATT
jgi:Rieske Fe-S protein